MKLIYSDIVRDVTVPLVRQTKKHGSRWSSILSKKDIIVEFLIEIDRGAGFFFKKSTGFCFSRGFFSSFFFGFSMGSGFLFWAKKTFR